MENGSQYYGHAPFYQSFSQIKLQIMAFIAHEMALIESVISKKCGGKRMMLQGK